MRKKIIPWFLLLFFAALALFSWWQTSIKPVNSHDKKNYIFVVPRGMGSGDIGKKLKQAGLIKSYPAFMLMINKKRISNSIQAGDYWLSPSMGLELIAQTLTHGTQDIWITLPEGLRKEQMAEKISQTFSEYESQFDKNEFLKQTENLEGYLFPDTYLIPKNASPAAVIKILNNTFEQKFNTLINQTNLNKKELVILASLIEREVKEKQDRKIVAGILLKRLEAGWPLQVDASVQYAKADIKCQMPEGKCDNWWPLVEGADLKNIESPYNTYLHPGLPPKPICNPGLDALAAVANPQESQYWYYLSDKKGKIHFAKTLEEQNKNIEKYLN